MSNFELDESPRRWSSKQANKGLAMDVVLTLLGASVVWVAADKLSFEDTRPLYNAWSYVVAVPIGLVVVDLVLRAFVSRFVERTLQIAFLLSILLHLGLTLGGFHIIVFVFFQGPTEHEALAASLVPQEQMSSSIPEYVEYVEQSNTSRPDYLRPAATSDTEASQADPNKLATELPATVPAQADIQDSIAEMPEARLNKIEQEFTDPEVQSKAIELERPQMQSLAIAESASIDIPENRVPESASSLPALEASESDVTPTRSAPSAPLDNLPIDHFHPSLFATSPSKAKIDRVRNRENTIPSLSLDAAVQAPGKRSAATMGPSASPAKVDVPVSGATSGDSEATAASQQLIASDGKISRRETRSSPMPGLAQSLRGLELGMEDLRPSVDIDRARSRTLAASGGRKGGLPDLDLSLELPGISGPVMAPRLPSARPTPKAPNVPIPVPAFQQRMSRNEGTADAADLGKFGPETEAAIERGLEFLSKTQRPDGSWRLEDFGDQPRLRSHTAGTGLALLSFQGAGYSHRQYHYAPVCKAAIEYLLANQQTDGDLYIPMDETSNANVRFYSHSIAALALCEAFGMTQDEALREPAQRAVQFMVAAQDQQGGGWRYQPGYESDTSVSGWFMMALKSAELAGLQVPPRTFEGIRHWLDQAQSSPTERHLYRYNPFAADKPETRHGLKPNPTMTGVGLLMRLYLGWRRDNPDMVRGADYLLGNPPQDGTLQFPQRDTYYWYYATQVLFHMGGERWQQWNNRLHPLLIQSQLREGELAGSWDAAGPIPDRWGSFAGRLYVTTLNLLSLEVYYRHLPIYEDTAR
jgi:hypothetical protein